MSNPQTTAVQGTANSNRPPLDLGPMTGDPAYIRARSEDLVRTFEALLDADIELINDVSGWTNCHSVIAAPIDTDPEGYLVVEHELSHWLFETDLVMTTAFVDYVVSRLLNRAGYKPGTDDARPYQKHLGTIVHSLWNVLEDWRCCWLWGELYAGGAELLQQRWHDICQYDMKDVVAEKSLVSYLSRFAGGVQTPNAPQDFIDCGPAMQRALNLVEGVGPAACLGITARFIDEILDVLLDNNPPPPPPPKMQGGGGGQGGQQQKKGQKQKAGGGPGRRKVPPKKKSSPRAQQKKDHKRESQHVIKLLCKLVPRSGAGSNADKPGGNGGLGENDLRPSPERKNPQLGTIKRIISADDDKTDETGMSPFKFLLHDEAERMQNRLEQARQAMMRNHDTPEQEQAQLVLGASKLCGIQVRHVSPARPLPEPTEVAFENRRILEQLRMKKRKKRAYDGEFDPGAFLNALGAGQLDQPFYRKHYRIAMFELLFLFDVSGSMTLGQALPLTERALADSVHAVKAIRSKAHMWAFSDVLYVFDEIGSVYAPGIAHGCTSMVQALDVAQKWARKNVQQRAIMLVTDGWPTSCRAYKSTGNAILDLRDVLEEIRKDKVALSVLGIRNPAQAIQDATTMYDTAFGEGKYGMVGSFDDLSEELPKAVRVLAEAHITKGTNR